jgi:hypothetical protein
MKNKYQIEFVSGKCYRLGYIQLVRSLVENYPSNTKQVENFESSFFDFTSKTQNQLELFIKNEEFSLSNTSSYDFKDEKELLGDLIPALCLSKSPSLHSYLLKLGFKEEILDLFIDKKQIDKSLSRFVEEFELPEKTRLTLIICTYTIAMFKCSLKTEEMLGFVHERREGRIITSSKRLTEQMSRRYRENVSMQFEDLTDKENQIINSNTFKSLFLQSNKVASLNKEGSYNIQILAAPMFILPRLNISHKISDRKIFLGLYEIFKILYKEKGLYMNETEWQKAFESLDPDKAPSGDNYADYRVKKVKSILGHSSTKKMIADYREQFKNLNGTLSFDDIINFLLGK